MRSATVAVLQGNIDIEEKWDPQFRSTIMDIYTDLAEQVAAENNDLIIWPEASLPSKLRQNPKLKQQVFDLANKLGKYMVVGSTDHDVKTGKYYNAAFLISPHNTIEAMYHKMRLVPFGEYVPWQRIFFFIDKITDAYGIYYAGEKPVVMPVGTKFKVGTFICYETLFPSLLRKFRNSGADILINITNDAWFGRSKAPYHHFSLLTFRAIENRSPIARAANTGISGFIDSNGRILEMTPLFQRTYRTETLHLDPRISFYSRYGDMFVYLCVIMLFIYFIQSYRKKILYSG
jgi:apolipoprotein N-acyltransferase